MQQTVWAMDGSFFAQRISGIQRYSIELLAAPPKSRRAWIINPLISSAPVWQP